MFCYTLVRLGYCIGLSKSILEPKKVVPYLGATRLLPEKREEFARLLEFLLSSEKVSLMDLEKLSGKCISMSLAVPGARLYTNEINMAVSRASKSSRPVLITGPLRQELEHWLFLKSWPGFFPWRSEIPNQFVLYTDASSYSWGSVFEPPGIPVVASDCWPNDVLAFDITVKEALALSNALESFKLSIEDSRVDVYVDSLALFHSWNGQSAKSYGLAEALTSILKTTLECNCVLRLLYVPSSSDLADKPSRSLNMSDSSLLKRCWDKIQDASGGEMGHSVDPMALRSNVVSDQKW